MTTETKREILKSFAYGYSVSKIVDLYGISSTEANRIKTNNDEEIKKIIEYLSENGVVFEAETKN